MAEYSTETDKISDANNSSEDEELDALLEDALKDFAKPDIACPSISEQAIKKKETGCSASSKKQHAILSKLNASSELDYDEFSSEESFTKMAEEFSKAFESIQTDEVDFLKRINEDTAENSSNQDNHAKPSLEENLKRAWSSLEKNVQDAKDDQPEDILDSDFLNAMRGLGMDGSDGGPEGLMSMMQGMMKNLLSKDILYPSLKEIHSKYPSWLDENRSSLSTEDCDRYCRQQDLVSKICIEYEAETDHDSKEEKADRLEKIMMMMQEMQACGQPPFELLDPAGNDLGLDPGQSGPNVPNPEQCAVM